MAKILYIVFFQCSVIFRLLAGIPDGRVPESVKELLDNGKVDAADPNYNPNYGYEPYWPNGEWVYELPRDRDMNISTTKVPTVCGEECNYLYTKIGNVCAHKSDDLRYFGCWWHGCSGYEVDDLTQGFTTFSTYCGFLDAKCKSDINSKWVFVHVGECLASQNLTYKPLFVADQPVSRMESYLSTLYSFYSSHGIKKTPFG
ncbi:uncharacterized protein LOC105841326 isoform X2 [Bombyx mori]|uniref:uncharacterized protein LOC105841326 isoform X2 n=1 Tax=Bombyx mori TaxID=7091 RepID=UPI002ED59375